MPKKGSRFKYLKNVLAHGKTYAKNEANAFKFEPENCLGVVKRHYISKFKGKGIGHLPAYRRQLKGQKPEKWRFKMEQGFMILSGDELRRLNVDPELHTMVLISLGLQKRKGLRLRCRGAWETFDNVVVVMEEQEPLDPKDGSKSNDVEQESDEVPDGLPADWSDECPWCGILVDCITKPLIVYSMNDKGDVTTTFSLLDPDSDVEVTMEVVQEYFEKAAHLLFKEDLKRKMASGELSLQELAELTQVHESDVRHDGLEGLADLVVEFAYPWNPDLEKEDPEAVAAEERVELETAYHRMGTLAGGYLGTIRGGGVDVDSELAADAEAETGTDQTTAETQQNGGFFVGCLVRALWPEDGYWYDATVSSVDADGACTVEYDDFPGQQYPRIASEMEMKEGQAAVAPAASDVNSWETYEDESGNKYYCNTATGETSWDPPPGMQTV